MAAKRVGYVPGAAIGNTPQADTREVVSGASAEEEVSSALLDWRAAPAFSC